LRIKNGWSCLPSTTNNHRRVPKHRGKHVAIYKNKIIADGSNSVEALKKALEKHPELKPEQIELYYIQIVDELIL
jgi:dihydroxyacetone kinase-like predicted kinase